MAVVSISHHLEEVAEIGDRVSVMRDGAMVGKLPADADRSEFVRLMVGRSIEEQFPRRSSEVGEVLLEVKHISREGADLATEAAHISVPLVAEISP